MFTYISLNNNSMVLVKSLKFNENISFIQSSCSSYKSWFCIFYSIVIKTNFPITKEHIRQLKDNCRYIHPVSSLPIRMQSRHFIFVQIEFPQNSLFARRGLNKSLHPSRPTARAWCSSSIVTPNLHKQFRRRLTRKQFPFAQPSDKIDHYVKRPPNYGQ